MATIIELPTSSRIPLVKRPVVGRKGAISFFLALERSERRVGEYPAANEILHYLLSLGRRTWS